ncbi:MAG: copper homeostasis protein CutC [Terriglobales bacterium]
MKITLPKPTLRELKLDEANRHRAVVLEICVTSVEFAMAAERGGADRIELCSDLDCGGVTPSLALMKAARERLRIPIHVLIRPRAGDFVYSPREFFAMRGAIQRAHELRMDGIVVGILDREFRVDVARTRELVELAHPLPVTFHRAFDETDCSGASLEAVIETGATRLLTSGGCAKATDGLSAIARLVKAAGERLSVMPGGGITPANVVCVMRTTGAWEVHGSLLTAGLRKALGEEDGEERRVRRERGLMMERYYRRVLKTASLLRSLRGY